MADVPQVFLSYSHDSDEHADRVLALADALRDCGIDVILDRYVHSAPDVGWPRWMDRNLDEAKFVLMVCTETYRRRVMDREEPGKGLGVRWEGGLIYNRIYHDKPSGSRFIPTLLPGSESAHIPNPVRGHCYYRITTFDLTDPGFEGLLRHLTGQPLTPPPVLGMIPTLPPRPRPQPPPGPLPPSGGPTANVVGSALGTGNTVNARDINVSINEGAMSPATSGLDDQIRAVLRRLMADVSSRKARLGSAFTAYPRLLERLAYDGETSVFLSNLLRTLRDYGEVEPGRLALAVLLESIRGEVGDGDRRTIDAILHGWAGPSVKIAPGEPWWNVPLRRNRHFTGREAIFKQLETALAAGMPVALSQAIAGLGGVGKTQTAVEYAYRHRNQYCAVLWVSADTEANLASGYRALAEVVLGLSEKDESDSTKVVAAVRRWLGREPGYLLILDNADDPALVKPYLPPDPTGHVLLTSRAYDFNVLGIHESIGLPVLTPDEALEFLQKRTCRKGPLDPAEEDAARTLAGELGYLPLALEQAAAYMREHEETFPDYLKAYREERLKLLDKGDPVAGEYSKTVHTTWKRSFDAVAAKSPASIALLRLSAFLAPDAIPYELILEGASELGEPLAFLALASPPGGAHALNPLLTPLAQYWLVRRDPEVRTYSVHRLVQAVLLDELTAATRKDLAERAVKALNRTFPDVEYANWPRCGRLVSHALAARGWIESEGLLVPAAAQLLNQAGYYLYVRARYAEAEPLYRRALAIWEVASGRDHPDTALGLNNLAVLLRVQGHLRGEAEELARRALDIREKALGPDHPDTAISLINLALLFQAQGRYGKAEPLYRRALDIREKALGPDHPDVAQSLNDLALLLLAQGRPSDAEPLCRRALAIWEKALRSDYPDRARSLDSLAYLHGAQGRLDKAVPLYRRALDIREKALGPDHPDTLTTRHHIAHWTGEAGDAREALRLCRELLQDRQRVLGPDQPDTLGTRHSIAHWTGEAGDAREALRLYRELLPDQERVLGPDQPDTLTTRHHIAHWTGEAGDAREALQLCHELLPDRQRVQGPDHPDTLRTRHSIAHWTGEIVRGTGEAGDAREALRLYRELLPDQEPVLGPDHPETLLTRYDIAYWTGEAGDAREALRLCRKLLLDRQRVLGPDHPGTLGTRHGIAHWTGEAGDAREALRLYRELLPDRQRVHGHDHPETLTTRHDIARWTGEAGDAREALRLYRELLPDRQRVLGPDHPDTLRTQAMANASK